MNSITNNKKSGLKTNLLILFISLLISVLVLELVARQLIPAPLPWLYPQIRYQADDDLIFSLAPEQHAYTADKPVLINERGLRGRVYDYAKDKGVERILFLGDSVVFGFGVDTADVVSSKVEQIIRDQGKQIESINTGIPSYNTDQEVAFLEREGVRYNPDWVVLGFYWNDVSDKSSVKVSKNGWLIERESDEENISEFNKFWISENGYLVRNLIKRSRLIYGLMQAYKSFLSGRSDNLNANLRADILEGRSTQYLENRWADIGAALQKFRGLADKYGFRPLIAVFPIPPALAKPYPDNKFVETVRGLAVRSGIPLLDLDPGFRNAYKGHESLFIPYDSDHPNAAGHAVAAREIVEFLNQNN